MLILGDGGGRRLGAFSGDEHLGAGRFGCAGLSAVPLAWPFLTPAVFFVRGFVSVRDFVARCVLVLATLVGVEASSSLPWLRAVWSGLPGFLFGFFSVYPDLDFRAIDFFTGFGLLPVCDPRASLGLQSGLLPAARCRLQA